MFSNAMSADYTFYVKTIETNAFLPLNISAVGTVARDSTHFQGYRIILG